MSQSEEANVAPDSLIDLQAGKKYWEDTDADINGMLGGVPSLKGFDSISRIDLQGSRTFLARLGIGAKRGRNLIANALDAGAGIGRITEGLLLHVAEQVDILEPVAKFTDVLKGKQGVRHIFNSGLEAWEPLEGVEYDLIWTQWCMGHINDEQAIEYLKTCKSVLKPETGVLVVKENNATGGADAFDPTDSSVTRTDASYRHLFEQAGFKIVRTELQRGVPETSNMRLMPVRMYALKPADQ